MVELSKQEQMILDHIQSKMDSNTRTINATVATDLLKIPYSRLITLCDHSGKLNYFMHSNPVILSMIEKKLRELNYISIPIYSIDGKEKHDVFDNYLGALMLQDYFIQLPAARRSPIVKKSCLKTLDQACELGFYNALVIRCKQSTSQATVPNLPFIARKKIIQLMTKDVQRLTNLYWSLGYLQAGSLWQILGDYFFDLTEEEGKSYGLILHEESLKNFICAFLLNKQAISIRIMNILTQGKGLASLSYEGSATIQTWDEFQAMIYSWLDGEYYKKISSLTEKEIENVSNSAANNEEKWKKAA